MEISIVIPFKDEEKILKSSLEKVLDYFDNRNFEYEVILVDDGSIDGSVKGIKKLLERSNINLIRNKENKGKGAAIQRGVLKAKYPLVLFSDADLSTPIDEIEKLLFYISGNDIVIGSRALLNELVTESQSFYRIGIGRFGNFLVRKILGLNLKDTQCGFKLFREPGKLFKKMTCPKWSFDYEILYLAKKNGWKIKEVPVRWENYTDSKFRSIRDSLGCFIDLIKIKLKC